MIKRIATAILTIALAFGASTTVYADSNIGFNIADDTGDIYYINENNQLIVNQKINGVYFNNKGYMQRLSTNSLDNILEMCKAYEDGEILYFKDDDSYIEWMEYYIRQYKLDNEHVIGADIYKGPKHNEIKYVMQMKEDKYNRDEIINTVLNKYGIIDVNISIEDNVYNILNKMRAVDIYEYGNIFTALDVAVKQNRMVCWQLARALKTVLDNGNIENEIIVVKMKDQSNSYHSIIRWRGSDNKWNYSDPTYVVDGITEEDKDKSYNIDSETFNKRYEVYSGTETK